jgi:hypothetical protein
LYRMGLLHPFLLLTVSIFTAPAPPSGYAYAPDPKVPAKLKVHFSVAPVDAPCTFRPVCHFAIHELSMRLGLITVSSLIKLDWVVAIGPKTTTNDPECAPCYDWAVVSDSLKVSRNGPSSPLRKRFFTPRSPCHCRPPVSHALPPCVSPML